MIDDNINIMEFFDELKDNIENGINFKGIAATGFRICDCPVCGGKKKAGFVIEDDSIVFNCFRGSCSVGTTGYSRNGYLSNKFKELLNEAGIELPLGVISPNNNFIPKGFEDSDNLISYQYSEYDIPFSYTKYDPNNKDHKKFKDYLDRRRIEYKDFIIYDEGSYKDCIILPMRYKKMMIGIQSIHIYEKKPPKTVGNSHMIFFPNGLVPNKPIIVEGVFDALSVPNGVAVMSSKVTKQQAYLLRRTDPVLLPDRDVTNFFKAARMYKWPVSLPDWYVKDSNEALVKYGKFVTAQKVYNGIISNYQEVEIKYSIWKQND